MNIPRFGAMLLSIAVCSFAINAQLLWKVSGNGLEKPSFLFGTHHVAPASMIDSIAGFDEAINTCDVVYGEVVKSDLTSPETQAKTLKLATAPADSTLSKVLDTKCYARLDSLFKASTAGMVSAANMEPFTPAFVSTQIAMLLTINEFKGFNPAQQLDITILQKAENLHKQLKGFETADFQINLLFGEPISEQAHSLTKLLCHIDESKTTTRNLASAYKSQDLEKIGKVFIEDLSSTGSTPKEIKRETDRLVNNRNDAWIEVLKTEMHKQSIFVSVGAGHLVNDKGLIAQLRNLGYTVTPMK